MELLVFLILGIVVCFNFVVILRKFRMARWLDATIDASLLTVLSFLFSGGYNSLVIGNTASALISIYLYFNPVTLKGFLIRNKEKEAKEEGNKDYPFSEEDRESYGRYSF